MTCRYWERWPLGALVMLTVACPGDLEGPTSVPLSEIISLKCGGSDCEQEFLFADGEDASAITATIPHNTDPAKNLVTFTTDMGKFEGAGGDGKKIEKRAQDGKVTAKLKTGTAVGSATVGAAVDKYLTETAIEFRRAQAHSMTVQTSSSVAKLDGSGNPLLTALLDRETGKVSLETKVRFKAVQKDNIGNWVPVGRFFGLENAKSDANQKATASFAADTGDVFRDRSVRIVVSTDSDGEGEEIQAELNLRVE